MGYTSNAFSSLTNRPLVHMNKDVFGVPWAVSPEGAMPAPGFTLFDDIEDWEDYVKFPDLDDFDVKEIARKELEARPVDRVDRVIQANCPSAMFERLVSLMGFENALIALAADPEECACFFEAMSSYLIDWNNRLIDAYGPDVVVIYDDVASAKDLFMSPSCYREVIAPYEKRIVEALKERDVLAQRHCCGKCDILIPDWIDMGYAAWHSAQVMNDLTDDIDRYSGQRMVEGGWDTQGAASLLTATLEDVREETKRCLSEYKKPGFVLCPILLNERGNSIVVGDDRLSGVFDEWDELRWL